jgi:hypothetical protein
MITKDQLREMGFAPTVKSEAEWTLDQNRVIYNVRTQTLYDVDEVTGDMEKLCVVKDAEELSDLIFSYFGIEIIH